MTIEISELKQKQEDQMSELFKATGVFFAFSDKQYQENKTPLKEGEKYVRIVGGGFMPKGNLDRLLAGTEAISAAYKKGIKDNNLRRKQIEYELHNHEAFYTGTITDTLEALGDDFKYGEVKTVYNEIRAASPDL